MNGGRSPFSTDCDASPSRSLSINQPNPVPVRPRPLTIILPHRHGANGNIRQLIDLTTSTTHTSPADSRSPCRPTDGRNGSDLTSRGSAKGAARVGVLADP